MTRMPKDRETVKLLNVHIDNFFTWEFLQHLKEGVVLTPNVDHLIRLQKDAEFSEIYAMADYRLCDSQILLFASHFLKTPVKERISGSDLFPKFCEFHKSNPNIRIFLLGGTDGASEKVADRINHELNRSIVVGEYAPPFGFENNEQECFSIAHQINQSKATVLAVGVGSPKQEKWIFKYKDQLPKIKIFLAIGATINFEARIISRAPKWVSQCGLEWFYRLMSEPRRLWKRYLIDDVPFVWLILKQKLGFYKNPSFSPTTKLSRSTEQVEHLRS